MGLSVFLGRSNGREETHVNVSSMMLWGCGSDGMKGEEEEGQLSTGVPLFFSVFWETNSVTLSCSHEVRAPPPICMAKQPWAGSSEIVTEISPSNVKLFLSGLCL